MSWQHADVAVSKRAFSVLPVRPGLPYDGGSVTRGRPNGLPASHLCSSVAQRQSIRLLTGGLLVRIQPEEPPPKSRKDLQKRPIRLSNFQTAFHECALFKTIGSPATTKTTDCASAARI
jgi:hypothetical protein